MLPTRLLNPEPCHIQEITVINCDVVNSMATELRAIAFQLTEVQMHIAPVRRRTRRSAALGALPLSLMCITHCMLTLRMPY